MAALGVVFAHLSGFSVLSSFIPRPFGEFGVDLFFVISGFIMWRTGKNQTPKIFALRRLIRIVPAYWFYTVFITSLAVLAPRLVPNVSVGPEALVKSLFFIPYVDSVGRENPILQQGWTLNYEVFFYGIFALALLAPKTWRLLLVILTLAALILLGAVWKPDHVIFQTYTGPMLFEFGLGMLLATVPDRILRYRGLRLIVLVSGAASLVATSMFFDGGELRTIFYGLPCVLFLAGLLGFEEEVLRTPNAALVAIGNASYSLYLIQGFVLSFAARVVSVVPLPPALAAAAFAILAVVGCVLVALLSYRLIEKPAARWLSKLLLKPIEPTGIATPTASLWRPEVEGEVVAVGSEKLFAKVAST